MLHKEEMRCEIDVNCTLRNQKITYLLPTTSTSVTVDSPNDLSILINQFRVYYLDYYIQYYLKYL